MKKRRECEYFCGASFSVYLHRRAVQRRNCPPAAEGTYKQAENGKDFIMKFYRKLYVSDSIKEPEKVKWKLQHNAGQFSIYLITLSQSEDQLDIFHSGLLKQGCYDSKDLFVVGLASSHGEAVDMVVKMAEKVAQETGGADLKGYILNSV